MSDRTRGAVVAPPTTCNNTNRRKRQEGEPTEGRGRNFGAGGKRGVGGDEAEVEALAGELAGYLPAHLIGSIHGTQLNCQGLDLSRQLIVSGFLWGCFFVKK